MQDYKKLQIYNEAEELALEVYRITRIFPKEEFFGITQQIRRAATSIGANIAEGTGRQSDPDFLRFLYHAMGSAKEVGHFLSLSQKLGYMTKEESVALETKLNTLSNRIGTLIKTIKASSL